MKTSDFDYLLPPELIAQTPTETRDRSRLLVLNRQTGAMHHKRFYDLVSFLQPGDVLVMNDTRVIPARLQGRKLATGARVEILLLRHIDFCYWEAMVKPAKKLSPGSVIEIAVPGKAPLKAEIRDVLGEGIRTISFSDESNLFRAGEMPLPPYIHTHLEDPGRYQTVYAYEQGSAAAPTAGLHFTPEILQSIKNKGIEPLFVTLHIGLDTFRPVKVDDPYKHPIHREFGTISEEVANRISLAKKEGRRVICVGTTSVRILEYSALIGCQGDIEPFKGWVDLLILPGFKFRVTDALLTNFHLPRSSLIMLVSAFAGLDVIKKTYSEAVARKYRFYSFGDAMLII